MSEDEINDLDGLGDLRPDTSLIVSPEQAREYERGFRLEDRVSDASRRYESALRLQGISLADIAQGFGVTTIPSRPITGTRLTMETMQRAFNDLASQQLLSDVAVYGQGMMRVTPQGEEAVSVSMVGGGGGSGPIEVDEFYGIPPWRNNDPLAGTFDSIRARNDRSRGSHYYPESPWQYWADFKEDRLVVAHIHQAMFDGLQEIDHVTIHQAKFVEQRLFQRDMVPISNLELFHIIGSHPNFDMRFIELIKAIMVKGIHYRLRDIVPVVPRARLRESFPKGKIILKYTRAGRNGQ